MFAGFLLRSLVIHAFGRWHGWSHHHQLSVYSSPGPGGTFIAHCFLDEPWRRQACCEAPHESDECWNHVYTHELCCGTEPYDPHLAGTCAQKYFLSCIEHLVTESARACGYYSVRRYSSRHFGRISFGFTSFGCSIAFTIVMDTFYCIRLYFGDCNPPSVLFFRLRGAMVASG